MRKPKVAITANPTRKKFLFGTSLLLVTNSLSSNSTYHLILANLLMTAYIITIRKSKFGIISLREFDYSELGC